MRASIGILIVSLSGVASAQDGVQQTIAEAEALAVRVEREAECLRRKHDALTRVLTLIRQAQQQMSATDDAVRRDARASIPPLFERLVRIEQEALGCRTTPPHRSRRTVTRGARSREPPPDPAADAVARSTNDLLIDRAYRIDDRVRVISGERVDGRGHMAADPVRSAVRSVGPSIAACGDGSSGRVILTFTVTGSGSVRRLSTEGSTIRSRHFLHCVRSAARRMRVSQGPQGGAAVFSYAFDFR